MIKRFGFVNRHSSLSPSEFAAVWSATATLVREAPADVRPLRAVTCTTLHGVVGTEAPYDGITVEWFADLVALQRFEAWLATRQGCVLGSVSSAKAHDATTQIVADEAVMRGADWLLRRWQGGETKLKHMALARRAHGLSAAEFSARWRSRPGTVGGAGAAPAIVIPEQARGHAYVQNHPVANTAAAPRYDAINEVYFDDLASMQARIDFFVAHDVGRADADLVSQAVFVAVTEQVVFPSMTVPGGAL